MAALAELGAPRYAIDDDDPPDKRERTRPAVDRLAHAGSSGIAIEHTLIEPYEGYVADQRLAHERLGPIRDAVRDDLPAGFVFDLTIEPGSAKAFRHAHVEPIVRWLREVIPTLGDSAPDHFRDSPPSVDPSLRVYRWKLEDGMAAEPAIRYLIGYDAAAMNQQALARCQRAMADKLPKLEAARDAHGVARTLLVLETFDFQMTNPWSLTDQLRGAIAGQQLDAPDDIALVTPRPIREPRRRVRVPRRRRVARAPRVATSPHRG